mgnify:CR=1 FL=1
MNKRILIIDFGIFSGLINMLIAWLIFDPKLGADIPVSIFSVDIMVSAFVIMLVTSCLATLSARRMLRVGRLGAVNTRLNEKGLSHPIVRLLYVAVCVFTVMSILFYIAISMLAANSINTSLASVVYIIYCGLLGFIYTPLVALNAIMTPERIFNESV